MNALLLVVFFLHMVSHAFGRPDYTLDDPKTRFSRSTQGNTNRNNRKYKYSLNLLHIDDGTIIFPHEENHSNDHHHRKLYKEPKIKLDSCENDICENVDDYPTEFIDKVLGKSKEFQDYFAHKAYAGAPPSHQVYNTQDEIFAVSDRVGGVGEHEEQTLCTTSVRTQRPKSIKNVEGNFILLANNDNYEQLVVTETCESNNLKCKFSSAFPNNYESGCKQKYTNQRMMGFNVTGHFIDVFSIPTCCVCYIKKIGT